MLIQLILFLGKFGIFLAKTLGKVQSNVKEKEITHGWEGEHNERSTWWETNDMLENTMIPMKIHFNIKQEPFTKYRDERKMVKPTKTNP